MMRDLVITRESYPELHRAFEIISHDRGTSSGHVSYAVPVAWLAHVANAHTCLAGMIESDLETFCVGEQGSQKDIAGESLLNHRTHELLTAFFLDWKATPTVAAVLMTMQDIEMILRLLPSQQQAEIYPPHVGHVRGELEQAAAVLTRERR
jgi:hypothetical protein